MKKLGITVLVLAALAGLYLWRYPIGSWRYRMTVTVQTPEGIKTGTAVRKITAVSEPQLFPEQAGANITTKGEAVVVDLGSRGLLFALLRSPEAVDYSKNIVFETFPMPSGPGGGATPEGIRYYSNLKAAKAVLSPDKYPMLVRFKDINDPKTVERVDPYNLTASFGEGVKLKEITIEMTSYPVTTGIEKIMPSFGKGSGFVEWQRTLPYGNPLRLDLTDFMKRTK